MTRRRLRSIILCTGTTVCVLTAAAFVLSGWWWVYVALPGGEYAIIASGTVEAVLFDVEHPLRLEWLGSQEFSLNWWSFRLESHMYSDRVEFPIWLPGLIVAIPTLLVWRIVPKFPRGHCRRCGYNLTGLTEPRCPECGTECSVEAA